jgi:hypothetical protein
MPELVRQHQTELLRDAERHLLAASVRRLRTVAGLPRRTAHRRAGPTHS